MWTGFGSGERPILDTGSGLALETQMRYKISQQHNLF
jgi:hypothetical protein